MSVLVQLGLGFGALAFVLFLVRWQAKEAQRQQDIAGEERDDAEAARRVAQAGQDAPRNRAELVSRLRDHGRGL